MNAIKVLKCIVLTIRILPVTFTRTCLPFTKLQLSIEPLIFAHSDAQCSEVKYSKEVPYLFHFSFYLRF